MSSWVRLWHDMPTDPKWRVIARASEQSIGNVIAVFNFLMVEASKNSEERGQANINTEDVAAALDISETDVQRILEAMQGRVMENGKLKGWEKRQPLREDGSANRAKAWRERNRTQPNAQERPDADADADADSEQNRTEIESLEDASPAATPEPPKPKMEKGKRLEAFLEQHGLEATCREWGEWSLSQGMTIQQINDEMAKFRDYWKAVSGGKGCKADWPATWRNWSRRALETIRKEEQRNAVFKNRYAK